MTEVVDWPVAGRQDHTWLTRDIEANQLPRGVSRSSSPRGSKVEGAQELETVDALDAHGRTHVRDMSVGPSPSRLGHLGGHDATLTPSDQRVGDQEWIPAISQARRR